MNPQRPISKLDMVKEAVHRSLAELPPEAIVSVIVFDTRPTVLVDPVPVRDWDRVSDRLDALSPGGGTVMDPAIELGLDLLEKSRRRYMILLTDGQTAVSPDLDPRSGGGGSPGGVPSGGVDGSDWRNFPELWARLTGRMRDLDVSLVTIALGEDADRDLLAYLAECAGGIAHECAAPEEVPTVFIAEVRSIRETTRSEAEPFRPRPGEAAMMLRGITWSSLPRLADALSARAKPLSQTVLLTGRGEPLLSLWRQSLGTVVAFTSDAKPVWARAWHDWKPFGRFWNQVVGWALRPPKQIPAQVETSLNGADLRILVSVTDDAGRPDDHLEPSGVLMSTADSDGDRRLPLSWRQVRPGVYSATARLASAASHLCRLSLSRGQRTVFSHTLLVSPGASPELAATGPDLEELRAIAAAGGGRLDPTPREVIESAREDAYRFRPMPEVRRWWPWLILAVVLLWMADVTVRRVCAEKVPLRLPA